MTKTLYISVCIILKILFVRGLIYTPVIKIASGPVRGYISKTIENVEYAAFKGIPFAEPPVNDLRFKPPVPIDRWTKVYDAVDEGNMCTQYNSSSRGAVGSEDCLYINVYTPHTKFNSSVSKAVMVWIYGGAFTGGFSFQLFYGPDFLLGQDVIVVSFNYRLSALGFLNLQHENAMGNCGMKDQNLALKWVKKNIAQFGGDPNKITIFGQSAGSASVDFHVLSDMSAGLFSQSIAMSGSPLSYYWGFQGSTEAVRNAFTLGSKLGTNTNSKNTLLITLYNASAADIVAAANGMGMIPFKPTLERKDIALDQEKFLTECAVDKYTSGNYSKGPHMVGFVSNETASFDELLGQVTGITKPTGSSTDSLNTHDNNIYHLIDETTDLFFILGIDTKQKLMSSNNNYPIYYYRFSFDSNYSFHRTEGYNLNGVAHGDELPYLFYMPAANLPLNDSDISTTRRRMVKLFTNFAKYGNPTPNEIDNEVSEITWPDSRANGDHLEIGKDLTTGPRPISNFVKIMQLFRLGDSYALNECANTNYTPYNPTPNGEDDEILGITWPDSRHDGNHLDISKNLTTSPRPTNAGVKRLQLSKLGASTIFTNCEDNLSSYTIS